ncbi:MAG TPA: ABC transporter substrate-binding protein, partial [Acidimicrobiales bacterium]
TDPLTQDTVPGDTSGTTTPGGTTPGQQGTAPGAQPQGAGTRTGTNTQKGAVASNAGGKTGPCAGREKQIQGDPYSPPCIAWQGDNGGATARGVTASEILVTARILNEKGFQQTLALLAGAEITDRPEDVERTIAALAAFFNKHYQFYGRKLNMKFYKGQGSSTTELLGGGQTEAQADARTVADFGAFAEINGGTPPFSDALAQKKVIAFGAPYLSRKWFLDHRPWNWSVATDCSIITESVSEFVEKQLLGKNAVHAGEGIKGKPRSFAVLAPENPWYQECVDDGEARMKKATGHGFDARIAYKLDINSMSNQAASIIAKLQAEGSTTVLCGCDPIMPVFLSSKAQEQGYNPEWIITGTALTDWDVVGQLYDQNQWRHAFGVSYLGKQLPIRAGLGYAAYKSIRPNDEPAFAVEAIYAQMAMLAIGIQMAGPQLTPQTFEQGMFNYPGGTGPFGTWGFDADSYTPTQDYRILWWNADGTSSTNNKKGRYEEAYGDKRFKLGDLPREDPKVFGQ